MKIDLDNLKRNLINLQNIIKLYDNINIVNQEEVFDLSTDDMYSWDLCSDSFKMMTINDISVSCSGNLEVPGSIISNYGLHQIKIVTQENDEDDFTVTIKNLNVIN